MNLVSPARRYTVRMMDIRRSTPVPQRFAYNAPSRSGQQAGIHTITSAGAPEASAALRLPPNLQSEQKALQTLIQPNIPPALLLQKETALPQIMVWNSPEITIKKIVTAPPQPVAEITVKPSLEAPNRELTPADIRISSSVSTTNAPLPPPSTTSPVNVHSSATVQQIPTTTSKTPGPPTPASVISLSEVKLQEGTVALPLVNEIAPTPFSGSLAAGQLKGLSQTGHGNTDSKLEGTGKGLAAGNGTDKGQLSGSLAGKAQTSGNGNGKAGTANAVVDQGGADAVPGVETGATPGSGNGRTTVRINSPKDGKFGVVVVGTSPTEEYPETLDLWSGRLAYTVYLHVDLSKNWIMQYSLPRSKEASPAGNVSRPDAPWPFVIVRPSIDADANTDAIMVHGFVDATGKFEHLAVVYPTELAETEFLLHSLQQWQFRPAMQNGQATMVEVLLVIPDEAE